MVTIVKEGMNATFLLDDGQFTSPLHQQIFNSTLGCFTILTSMREKNLIIKFHWKGELRLSWV